MSDFTFENAPFGRLETYEWDNVWWEKNNDPTHPRLMYIGDSISCGIRSAWRQIEDIEWYFDNCGTTKSLDNPYLLPFLTMFYRQMLRCDAILINNGLHGWHLSTEEYAAHYEALLRSLKEMAGSTPLILVTTTSVTRAGDINDKVLARNAAAVAIAEKLGLRTIDLYPTSESLEHPDGIHLRAEGYAALVAKIREELREIL